MTSIMERIKRFKLWPIIVWLIIWEAASIIIGEKILIASPFDTLSTLWSLLKTSSLYIAITTSLLHVLIGFLIALILGFILGVEAFYHKHLKELIDPFMAVIKSIPVASFIILVLIMVSADHLSIIIAFLMVLPLVYENVYKGLSETEKDLIEVSEVYELDLKKRFRYIYLESVYPYLDNACHLGLSYAFKAGIAAEVIGLPDNSIGEHLYEAKIYLATSELFAWTFIIIVVSALCTKIVSCLYDKAVKYLRSGV